MLFPYFSLGFITLTITFCVAPRHTCQLSPVTCLSLTTVSELSYHSELLLVVAGRVEWEQRAVVTDLALPVSVEIVRHHVDHVHMPARGNTTIRFLGHSEVWLS